MTPLSLRAGIALATLFLLGLPCSGCGSSDSDDSSSGSTESSSTERRGADAATNPANRGTEDDSEGDKNPQVGDSENGPEDTANRTIPTGQCSPRSVVAPSVGFFVDISAQSGIRQGNYDPDPPVTVPINDHSRLAFGDITGNGWDDIVMHSLYPNPQAGIPFEHLVFMNRGDGTFMDISDASGLRNIQAGFFAFGDVDNDGDQDIFAGLDIQLAGKTHQLLLNDGTGLFTKKSSSGLESAPTIAGNAILADFNGDANLDLFIGNGHTSYAASDAFYWGQGDGTFTNASTALVGNPAQPTNGSVACDYDNDGDLDIVVSTYGVNAGLGLNILWENQGSTFTNVAVERGFASLAGGNYWLGLADEPEPNHGPGDYMGSNGFGVDCKDINHDGLMDIFLTTISHPQPETEYSRKWSDPSQLLMNLGPDSDYAFENQFLDRGLPFNEGDLDGAIFDFDNDGLMDLSFSREKKYESAYEGFDQKGWFGLMHQKSDGQFESLGEKSGINVVDAVLQASLTACVSDADCTVSGEACLSDKCRVSCDDDSDCPGEHELCHTKGFCKLYHSMKMAQNHAWADIDHDGDVDLLVGGRDTGGGRPNFLFRNDIGSQNRWLAFRLEGDGVAVNRDAIGARVSLVFSDRTLLEEVRSTRGMYNSMDSRIIHFGLGDLGCEYIMEVRWPDGTEASFTPEQLSEESFHRLVYPDQLSVGL